MKITLSEVECLINMYQIVLSEGYVGKEDVDYVEKRIQYWNEIKKNELLED